MTLAVYLLKRYAGIDSVETIGDRFTINSQLPDAVIPALMGRDERTAARSHHHRRTGRHRIAAVGNGRRRRDGDKHNSTRSSWPKASPTW